MGLETTIKLFAALAVAMALTAASPASGQQQQAASCTTSLLTSFAPCFNFLTTNGTAAAPTADCCRSLAALVDASAGCACLVLTGNVPLGGAPVNRTLAVTLPRACNSAAVPLRCRDTPSTQIPAPGPVAVTPSVPPLPPATPATPESEAPVSQGQTRPAVLPSSARRTSSHASATAAFVVLLAAGAALV